MVENVKKSKFLALIIISIICIQLFAYMSIQVSGNLASESQSANNANTAVSSKNWYSFLTWLDFNNHHILSNHLVGNIEVSPKEATIVAGQSQTFEAFANNRGYNSIDVSNFPGIVWSINSGVRNLCLDWQLCASH